jgi:hypothetical protein
MRTGQQVARHSSSAQPRVLPAPGQDLISSRTCSIVPWMIFSPTGMRHALHDVELVDQPIDQQHLLAGFGLGNRSR